MPTDHHREGLRILRNDPTLVAMELLWRWSFGLGLLALSFFAYAHLREALMLSDTDQLAFSSQRVLALATAFLQSTSLLLRYLAPLVSIAAVLWIASASLGRGIITRIIVHRLAATSGAELPADRPHWTSFAIIMFGRVVMLLILVIGYLVGALLASFLDPAGKHLVVSALLITGSLACSCALWTYVNRVLSLAPIFIVRDGLSPLDAISESIAFLRRNRASLASIALRNAGVRTVAISFIGLCVIFTISIQHSIPAALFGALLALQAAIYFICSDFILLVRYAAYASVATSELIPVHQLPTRDSHAVLR